jgi:DNA polymerase zeta
MVGYLLHLLLISSNLTLVKRYIAKLFGSLNHAIALSLKRNPRSHNSQYIRAIVLVKGVHFYGFHSAFSPFFKILVADPSYMNRISTILQSGSVMSTRFRVYESHLNYILQFLCDFGLYGCGFIELEDVFERCAPQAEEQQELVFSDSSTPTPFESSSYFRESRLPLEVDAIAPHILNRRRLAARNVHHRLEIPAPLLPSEPLVLGVRELWEDERNRRQTLGLDPSPELPIDPSESSRGAGGEWAAEAHWWDEIRHRIQNIANEEVQVKGSEGWERFVMTTFESIEAIWEKEYKVWKPAREEVSGTESVDPVVQSVDKTDNGPDQGETDNQVDVDISKLSNQDISELDQREALGEGWNKTMEQAQHDHDEKGEVEEEAALEDDLTEEELADENKVEDSHTLRSLTIFLLLVITDTYLVQKTLSCKVWKMHALKHHLIDWRGESIYLKVMLD